MDWMETLIVVVHVVIAVALVGLVLIQQGKGADAGAAFGGGASQTVFGSQGSGSFLTRMTTAMAVVFFVTSFSLAVFAKQRAEVAGGGG
ncbi:MAG TPA: preprotein translocase subunit SecG, partial [Marinobacter sp.]|nr:preprotein translocase subunit SecG [Marinobacter sp.]